jgi:hypothetical protein
MPGSDESFLEGHGLGQGRFRLASSCSARWTLARPVRLSTSHGSGAGTGSAWGITVLNVRLASA